MFSFFRTKVVLFVTLREHDSIEKWYDERGIRVRSELDPTGDVFNIKRLNASLRKVRCVYKIRGEENATLFTLMWSDYLFAGNA